jgi:predicted transcriptional regulator
MAKRKTKKTTDLVEAVKVEDIVNLNLPDVNKEVGEVENIEDLMAEITHSVTTETPLSMLELYVAELKLKGYSPKKIANKLGVTEAAVRRTLNSKPVRDYIKQVTEGVKETLKEEMIILMRKTIEDKIKYIEDKYDGDFSKATRKDLPDLLKMLDDMMKEEEKAKLGTSQNIFVSILNQVID